MKAWKAIPSDHIAFFLKASDFALQVLADMDSSRLTDAILFQRYTVTLRIGGGSFGEIYKCSDNEDGTVVSLFLPHIQYQWLALHIFPVALRYVMVVQTDSSAFILFLERFDIQQRWTDDQGWALLQLKHGRCVHGLLMMVNNVWNLRSKVHVWVSFAHLWLWRQVTDIGSCFTHLSVCLSVFSSARPPFSFFRTLISIRLLFPIYFLIHYLIHFLIQYAAKFESRALANPQLRHEYKIYRELKGLEGICVVSHEECSSDECSSDPHFSKEYSTNGFLQQSLTAFYVIFLLFVVVILFIIMFYLLLFILVYSYLFLFILIYSPI